MYMKRNFLVFFKWHFDPDFDPDRNWKTCIYLLGVVEPNEK